MLDYDVEQMADYVTEMSTRLVMPHNPKVNPAFRKFMSQILTSTRLPSTTILLGMNYLAKRLNSMEHERRQLEVSTENQIWRMVTVSLVLGSKFLDDNTFQNKSWSEVSGVPVRDLNTLEHEWLNEMGWCLYVNPDESQDYQAWLANWKQWLKTKKDIQEAQAKASRERLHARVPPIETDFTHSRNPHVHSTWLQQQAAELERYSSMKRNQGPAPYHREQTVWGYNASWQPSAPLTPPDSGYGTPEWSNSATSMNAHYADWFDRAIVSNNCASRQYQQPAPYGGYHPSGHSTRNQSNFSAFYNYGHGIWEHSGVADCNCAACLSPHTNPPSYFVGHSYSQPVVG